MFQKYGIALIVLSLVCVFHACGQKEQAEVAEAPDAEVEEAAPEIVPGEMILIPEGEFIMGTDDEEDWGYPERKVTLPAFWIDKYEVTNLEFLDFTNATNYVAKPFRGQTWRTYFSSFDKANYPVVLTYDDAEAYCKSHGKRLPTEAEWEKAARGTEGYNYPWGNEFEPRKSNTYEAGFKAPVAIGQFKQDVSPFGVYDMLGNVQEWTSSIYGPYKGNPRKDDNLQQGMRVVRGLSSRYQGKKASLYARSASLPDQLFDFGCRCARDATPEEVAEAAKSQ